MVEQAPYIHVEGMDLAGKTAAANLFVNRRADYWEVKRNSLSERRPVYDLADEMLESGQYSGETIGMMYAAALMADIDQFRRPEVPTIQESTIVLRSVAYQAVNGTPRIAELFKDILPKHPGFDASFMLIATYEERMRRLALQERHYSHNDLLIVRDPTRFFAMEALIVELAKKHFQSEVIDTSGLSISGVVSAIERGVQAKRIRLLNKKESEQ